LEKYSPSGSRYNKSSDYVAPESKTVLSKSCLDALLPPSNQDKDRHIRILEISVSEHVLSYDSPIAFRWEAPSRKHCT